MRSPRRQQRNTDTQKNAIEAVNAASVTASLLHAGFVLLCLYVLVVAIATQDIDLARGKTIKLAGVDATVSIVGFYVAAPLVVFGAHFNLLVHLRLLVVRIAALNATTSGTAPWRNRVQIFPFTNLLLTRPSDNERRWLLILTSTTLQILPLLALLALYCRFLAYQSQPVTWLHRVVILADVCASAWFWLNALGGGKTIHQLLWPPARGSVAVALASVVACFTQSLLTLILLVTVVLTLFAVHVHRLYRLSSPQRGEHSRTLSSVVTGAATVVIVATFATTVDGEPLEWIHLHDALVDCRNEPEARSQDELGLFLLRMEQRECRLREGGGTLLRGLFDPVRHLNLFGAVLTSETPRPEEMAALKSGDVDRSRSAAALVQPVDLSNRSLRRANLSNAIMPSANFQDADLEGANLASSTSIAADFRRARLAGSTLVAIRAYQAQMNGAVLAGANLGGSDLREAALVAADLRGAKLNRTNLSAATLNGSRWHGALLYEPRLHGAQLVGIEADGVDFRNAQANSANFQRASLVAARFNGRETRLAGANFSFANLSGADFTGTALYGIEFKGAELVGTSFLGANLFGAEALRTVKLVDLRGARLDRPSKEYFDNMILDEAPISERALIEIRRVRDELLAIDPRYHLPLAYGSCIVDEHAEDKEITCEDATPRTGKEAFAAELRPVLVSLACYRTNAAMGFVRPGGDSAYSLRIGVPAEILRRRGDPACKALADLTSEQVRALTESARDELRALQGARQPLDIRGRPIAPAPAKN